MTYTMIRVGNGTGGGMLKHPVPGAPSMWLPYVDVDDIRAATDKAKSLGATIMRDVTPVPNAGSFSIIVDPTGAMLGLWQEAKKQVHERGRAVPTGNPRANEWRDAEAADRFAADRDPRGDMECRSVQDY